MHWNAYVSRNIPLHICMYLYIIQLYVYVRCLDQNTSVYIVYYASLLSVSFIQRQDYDEIKIYIFRWNTTDFQRIYNIFLMILICLESMTEIVGGPDIYVDRLSTLQLTCRWWWWWWQWWWWLTTSLIWRKKTFVSMHFEMYHFDG